MRYAGSAVRETTRTWRACASVESVVTRFWNTATGGPSIDSKAMLEPRSVETLAIGAGEFAQPAAERASAKAAAIPSRARLNGNPRAPAARRPVPLIDTPGGSCGRSFHRKWYRETGRWSSPPCLLHERDGADVAGLIRFGATG